MKTNYPLFFLFLLPMGPLWAGGPTPTAEVSITQAPSQTLKRKIPPPGPEEKQPELATQALTWSAVTHLKNQRSKRTKAVRIKLNAAMEFLRINCYEEARALAMEVLEQNPGNRRARAIVTRSSKKAKQRNASSISLSHDLEFSERMEEVEKASIPYIEPKKIRMSGNDSPYSQEIKMEAESTDITAMRDELKDVFVDLDFRNADLREVIRYLAEVSEVNIVIDESALLKTNQPATGFAFSGVPMGVSQQAQAIGSQGLPGQNGRQPTRPGQNLHPTANEPPAQSPSGQVNRQQLPSPGGQPTPSTGSFHPQGTRQNIGSRLVPSAAGVPTFQAPTPPRQESLKVSIYLKNVPLLTALDIILRTKGMRYRIERDFIWISTEDKLSLEDLVTRIYTIQHAIGDFANFAADPLNLDVMNLTSNDDLSSQFFNQAGTSNSTPGHFPSNQDQEKTEAQAAEDLVATLKKIVPQPSSASMTLYTRTGKLIVRNTPSNLRILEGLLRNLDVSSLQVSIEVRMVEVSILDGLDIGIKVNWKHEGRDNHTAHDLTSTNNLQGFGRLLTTAGDEGFSYVFNKFGSEEVTASIQALVAKNRGTILSAPKLTCLNNQTANIKIVQNTNYIASTKTISNTTDGLNNTSVSQTIGQIPEGIVLEITPNVSADQSTIRLTVHPQVTELVDFQTIEKSNTFTQLPSITQRSLDTTISVANGGTLILGGLMRGSKKNRTRGVPGLSAIPILGNAFKNHNKVKDQNNLIIFITASILDAEGTFLQHQELGLSPK